MYLSIYMCIHWSIYLTPWGSRLTSSSPLSTSFRLTPYICINIYLHMYVSIHMCIYWSIYALTRLTSSSPLSTSFGVSVGAAMCGHACGVTSRRPRTGRTRARTDRSPGAYGRKGGEKMAVFLYLCLSICICIYVYLSIYLSRAAPAIDR